MNDLLQFVRNTFANVTLPAVAGALLTLFAAFFGSYAAFLLENVRRKRAEKRANRAAGNTALLALGFYWNEIALFKRDQVDPFRDSPGRHILMPPVLVQIEQSYKIDFESLQFIVDDGDVDLLNRLSVAERLFLTTVELIRRRSQLHAEDVQPRLDAAGIGPDTQFTLEDLAKIVGPRIDGTLRQMTNDTIKFVDDADATLLQIFWELRRDLKKIFPKDKFVISVPRE